MFLTLLGQSSGDVPRTIWRLASDKSRIGDAVDAGIPAHIATEVLSARDRVAQHYSGRTSASGAPSTGGKSVFVEESSRKVMDEEGNVDRDKLLAMIMSSIEGADINEQAERVHKIIRVVFETIKECIQTPPHPDGQPRLGWLA